jgi:hypothetical protein
METSFYAYGSHQKQDLPPSQPAAAFPLAVGAGQMAKTHARPWQQTTRDPHMAYIVQLQLNLPWPGNALSVTKASGAHKVH